MTGHRHNHMGQNHSHNVGHTLTQVAQARNPVRSLIGKSSSYTQTGYRLSTYNSGDRFITTYQDTHRMSQSNSAPLHTDVSAPNNLDWHRVNFDSFAPVRDTAVSRLAVCTDRSSPLTPVSDPGSFVGSLRKYPSPQPEHSTSADLIHKLLSHTHITNITISSHHSKSLRCLKNTQEEQRDPEIPKKASKNVQTYTRNHYDIPNYYQGTVELEDRARKRIIKEDGPGCSRTKEDDFYYDYLKPYCVARFDTTSRYGTPGTSPTRSRSRHSTTNIDSPRTSKSRTDTTRVPNMSNKSARRAQYITDRSPKACSSRTERISLRRSPNRSDITSAKRRGKDNPAGPILDINSKTSQIRTDGSRMYINTEGSSKNSYRFEGSPINSPSRWNKPEVRYLNDVTKYVRDAIRQIYEEQPQTCPRMSSRYSQHRREFHRNGPAAGSDWASIEIQTSPRQSHVTSRTCPNSPTISPKTSPIRKSCLICHKPLPCGCSKSRKIKFRSPNVCNTRNECNSEENITDRDYINRKIEDVIFDWLQDIPVYASYSPGDRCQRDRVTYSLIDGIIRYYGSDNFEKIARDEILSCLTQLPMWYPNKEKNNEFRNEQTEKLIRKLRNVKSKRDKFGETIAKWFKKLTFKTTHDGKVVNKRAILKDITQQLRRVALKKHATVEEYYNCLKEKAFEIIEQLPLEVECNRMRVNQKLNDHLMDRLAMISVRDIKKKLDYDPENEFEWEVLDFVEDLPEFAELSETEGRNALKKLAKKLKDLRAQNLNYDEVYDEMETAINDWVELLHERLPIDVENEFQKDIFGWIEENPAIASENPEEKSVNDASAKVLAETLNRLQKEGFEDDVIQDQMLTAIKDALTSYLQRKGKRMDIKNKHRLAELLLDKLSNTVEKGKRMRQVSRLVKKKAKKWLQELSDFAFSTPEERHELDKLAQILANDINEMQKNGVDGNIQNEMLEKIQAIYETALTKKGTILTPKHKKKASDILLKKFLYLLKNVEDPIPTREIEDHLQKIIVDKLEDVFLLDKTDESIKKELERIATEIAKNIAVKATEGIYDEHVHQEILEEIKFNLDQSLEKNHPYMSIDDNVKNETAENILVKILVAINKAEKIHKLPEQYKKYILCLLENFDDLNKTPADKIENEKLTQVLTKKLAKLQAKGIDDELIKDEMRKEIENCLQHTLDKRGVHISPIIAKKHADDLLKHLENETKNAAKPQIATEEMINEFEKEIGYFIEDIPQWTRDTFEQKSANSKVSKYLAKNLNLLQFEGIHKEVIKDAMLKEIKSHLDLGAEYRKQNVIDLRDKDVLAEKLLDNIITKADQLQRKYYLPEVMLKEICKWIENISTFRSMNDAEKKLDEKAARTFTNQLIKFLDKKDIEEYPDQIKIQIDRFIETLLSRKGEHLDTKTKQTLTRDLFDKIFYIIIHYGKRQVPTNELITKVQRVLSEWIPENLKETVTDQKETENMVHRMTKNLIDLHTQGVHNDEVQQNMIDYIKDEIDIAYKKKGDQIDCSQKNYLAEKLFDEIVTTADRVKKEANLLDVIMRDVLNWVEEIPEFESFLVSEKNASEQWARALANNLKSIKRNSLDVEDEQNQMMKEIKMNLDLILEKKGQQMNPSRKIKLCENLVMKVLKQKQQIEKNSVPTKTIENEFRENIETCILNDVPVQLAGKQREKIVEKLAKDLNKIHVEGMQDENCKKNMLDKVEVDLEEMLTKYGGEMSQDKRHEIAENIVSSLCLTGDTMSKKQNLAYDLEKNVSDWVEDIPTITRSMKNKQRSSKVEMKNPGEELPDTPRNIIKDVLNNPDPQFDNTDIENLDNMSKNLVEKMNELKAQGYSDEKIQDIIMNEMGKELDELCKAKGVTLDPNIKNKFKRELFNNMGKSAKDKENNKLEPQSYDLNILALQDKTPEEKEVMAQTLDDETAKELAKKYKQLKDLGLTEDEIKNDMAKELDKLSTDRGIHLNAKDKNTLTGKVTDKIEETNSDEPMSSFLDNIPGFKAKTLQENNRNNQIALALSDKYQELKYLGLTEDEIKKKMAKELDTLSTDINLNEKDKNTLIGKVIDKIDETNSEEPISSLFNNTPDFKAKTLQEKNRNKQMALAQTDKYQKLKGLGLAQEEIQENMTKELDYLLEDRGVTLNAKDKKIFLEHAMDKEVLSLKKNVEHWSKEINELSNVTKNQTDDLANKLQKINEYNLDTKTQQKLMQNEIGDWLDNVARKNNTQLTDFSKDNYINKLVKEVGHFGVGAFKDTSTRSLSRSEFKANSTPALSQSPIGHSNKGPSHFNSSTPLSKSGKSSTSHQIPGSRTSMATQRLTSRIEKNTQSPTDLYYIEQASSSSRSKNSRKSIINLDEIKDLDDLTQKKITAAIANNLDVLDSPNIGILKNQVVDILKDVKFPDEEARIMSKNIIIAARNKGNTGVVQARRESAIKGNINNIVSNLLDLSKVTQRRPSIDNNVVSYIMSSIINCEDVTKVGIQEHLKASGLPNDKINEIADKIVQEVNMIPLTEHKKTPWTPMEKDNFKEKAAAEITHFMDGITGDISPEDKVKVQEAIERAIGKISDILDNPNLNEDEKQSLIRDELLKELQGLPIDSAIPLEELVNQLIVKVMDVGYGARHSTPRGSWDESMAMQREVEYLNKVAEAISDWAETLPISSDILNNGSFHETITKDLAGDIVDRQKYLQLHPEAKKSNTDEIGHMKYQVYRWLNKFLDSKDLDKTVLKVPSLMDALKKIVVPQLVRPTKRRRSRLAKGQIPTFLDALEDEISMWMDEQPLNLFLSDDEEVKQQMVKSLALNVQAHKGRCNAEDNMCSYIIDWLPKTFNNASSADLNRMQEELLTLFRNKGFTDDSWAPSTDTSQYIDENSSSIFEDWLRKVPFYHKRNQHERYEQEMLMAELAKALKSIVQNSDGEELEDQLLDETAQRLKDIVMDQDLKNDESYLRKVAKQIFDYLKKHQMSYQGCCSILSSDRTLEDVVDDWVVGIQTCNRSCQQNNQLETKKKELISCLKRLRQQYDVSSCQYEPVLKTVIDNFFQEYCKKYDEMYKTEKINELLRHLRTIPVDLDGSFAVYTPKVFKKPTDVLFEDIDKWCKDLPIYNGDDEDDDKERVQTFKHSLACKIINKLGELNMNPEIFNDEFLYEDLLTDQIDNILVDLPRNPELDKYLPALKMDLIYKIKEGRQRLRDDLAGKAYKQLLRDTIKSSMYISENLSSEEEASFEILKDNLADAFINLHYVSDNDDERNRFKKKINEELTKFCTKFLRRHPSSPIDPSKIHRDLYCALRRLPIPKDESMRSEVEQSRVKDVIDDWIKDLRLKEECGTGLLHRNKMATVLAKRIQELEREKESNPLMDCDHKIVDETAKFLRKLSLSAQEYRIPEWSEMLKCRLKCSVKTRKFDVCRPCYAQSQTDSVCASSAPCGLSNEDRAHLQRIKNRVGKSPPYFKDAYVCTPPQDAGSQTSLRCWDRPHPLQRRGELRNNSCQTKPNSQHSYGKRDSCTMTPNHTPSQSGYEILPRVIVKEYLWNSDNTSKMQSCSTSCATHPSTCRGHTPISCGSYPPHQPCPSCVGIQQGQSYTHKQQKPCGSNENQKCKCTTTKSEEIICPRQSGVKNRHISPNPEESSDEQENRSCRRPHVTRLGSFDSDHDRYCGRNKNKTKKKDKFRREEDSGWSDHEQDEDASFWGSNHKMCGTPSKNDSFVRHKETLKCKCRERVMMTCKEKPNQGRILKDTCTTCRNCPHPSYLFFK